MPTKDPGRRRPCLASARVPRAARRIGGPERHRAARHGRGRRAPAAEVALGHGARLHRAAAAAQAAEEHLGEGAPDRRAAPDRQGEQGREAQAELRGRRGARPRSQRRCSPAGPGSGARCPGRSAGGALRGLAAAEKTLIQRGGRTCGKLQRVTRAPKPEVGGGGFTPEPSRGTDEIEQGETEEHLGTGRYRPSPTRARRPRSTSRARSPPSPSGSRHPGRPRARRLTAGPLTLFGASDVGVPAAHGRAAGADDRRRQERRRVHGQHRGGVLARRRRHVDLDGPLDDPEGPGGPAPLLRPARDLLQGAEHVRVAPAVLVHAGHERTGHEHLRNAGTVRTGSASRCRARRRSASGLNTATPGRAGHLRFLSPALFGFGGSTWFDRSDIGVNSAYLNFTTT